jgi:hypothetical protein
VLRRFWLAEYAPELIAAECRRFPTIDHVRGVLGGTSTVLDVPIPIDCLDGFGEAFYGRPEAFLDPAVRQSQSGWKFVDAPTTTRSVERLRADLASGDWDRRHGALRSQPDYHGAVRLVTALPGAR